MWPDVRQAVLPPTQTKPPLTKQEDGSGALDRANQVEEETEEVEDDKYVPPDGQGCFSFRQSLLLRSKDTYAARSIGNKYEIISRWLLTGLAVVLSRPNWLLLAKKGTLTSSRAAPEILSGRIPGWPQRQSRAALRAPKAQCHHRGEVVSQGRVVLPLAIFARHGGPV